MKQTIDRWNALVITNRADIGGFALCACGTKRSAYWTKDGFWTYSEKDAKIFIDRDAAIKVMWNQAKDMSQYTRLVPIVNALDLKVFPTVNGY